MNKAGGARTNLSGKNFEKETDNENFLLKNNFIKKNFWIEKEYNDKKIIFLSQGSFKKYIKEKFDIEIFRNPDEAYIIVFKTGKIDIKILEKKKQNVHGSVETKLWASPSLKREYELVLENFTVEYALCLSNYFKEKINSSIKKYKILQKILDENSIEIFYGSDLDYFEKLHKWIHQ